MAIPGQQAAQALQLWFRSGAGVVWAGPLAPATQSAPWAMDAGAISACGFAIAWWSGRFCVALWCGPRLQYSMDTAAIPCRGKASNTKHTKSKRTRDMGTDSTEPPCFFLARMDRDCAGVCTFVENDPLVRSVGWCAFPTRKTFAAYECPPNKLSYNPWRLCVAPIPAWTWVT